MLSILKPSLHTHVDVEVMSHKSNFSHFISPQLPLLTEQSWENNKQLSCTRKLVLSSTNKYKLSQCFKNVTRVWTVNIRKNKDQTLVARAAKHRRKILSKY